MGSDDRWRGGLGLGGDRRGGGKEDRLRGRLVDGRFLDPARFSAEEGCLIEGARIERSLIGIRAIIKSNVTIRNTYMMGADYYESDEDRRSNRARGVPDMGIGPGTTIENAIITDFRKASTVTGI